MAAPLRAWLGPARPSFLLLTPACIVLAVVWSAAALAARGLPLSWADAGRCLLGALAAHVAVNALNEHGDFRSGLDLVTQRTPFSGGSGALPAHPELAGFAWWLGVGGLMVAAFIGLCLLWAHPGLWLRLMPLGLAGLLLAVAYTPWLTHRPWLCLMAPGLGFGPLMVWGTEWVLMPPPMAVDWRGLVLAAVPFALVNNLLLLNQFPDVEADARSGRMTLPMRLGRRACLPWLALQYAVAYGVLAVGAVLAWWPPGAALGLLTLPLAMRAWLVARRHAEDTARLLPALGMNVAVALLTPSLAALGLFMGLRVA